VDTEGLGGLKVVVAAQSSSQCVPSTNKNHSFPADIDRFEIRLSGSINFATTLVEEDLDKEGQVLVMGIPPAENLTLDLYGCKGDQLQYSGRTLGVNIKKNDKTAPALYFTKKSAFSCTGSATLSNYWSAKLPKAVAFHKSALTDDGELLIVGGFTEYFAPSQLSAGGGGADVYLYAPTKGMFRAWKEPLHSPRGWHHLIPFDDGRKMLVVGGASSANFGATTNPPLRPTALPEHMVELIDVDNESIEVSTLSFEAKPMGAIAHSADGHIIVSAGGANLDGTSDDAIWRIESNAGAISDGSAVVAKGQMTFKRQGHTANYLKDGDVLILGGNTSSGSAAIAEVIHTGAAPEDVLSSPVNFELGQDNFPALALHQTALIQQSDDTHLFMVAGGAGISENLDGTAKFNPPHFVGEQLYVVEIQGSNGLYSGRVAIKTGGFSVDRLERAFHSLTALGNNLFLLGGGYSTFAEAGLAICDDTAAKTGCYLSDALVIETSGGAFGKQMFSENSLNSGLTFSTSRFGHGVNILPDGTALVTGGLRDLPPKNAAGGLLNSAEILNPMRIDENSICVKTAPGE